VVAGGAAGRVATLPGRRFVWCGASPGEGRGNARPHDLGVHSRAGQRPLLDVVDGVGELPEDPERDEEPDPLPSFDPDPEPVPAPDPLPSFDPEPDPAPGPLASFDPEPAESVPAPVPAPAFFPASVSAPDDELPESLLEAAPLPARLSLR